VIADPDQRCLDRSAARVKREQDGCGSFDRALRTGTGPCTSWPSMPRKTIWRVPITKLRKAQGRRGPILSRLGLDSAAKAGLLSLAARSTSTLLGCTRSTHGTRAQLSPPCRRVRRPCSWIPTIRIRRSISRSCLQICSRTDHLSGRKSTARALMPPTAAPGGRWAGRLGQQRLSDGGLAPRDCAQSSRIRLVLTSGPTRRRARVPPSGLPGSSPPAPARRPPP
jgi:hypothetical protein